MHFDIHVKTHKSAEVAVAAVIEAAERHDFVVVATHPMSEMLAGAGFEHEPNTLVEICNKRYAHEVLSRSPVAALLLPCPILVREHDGHVVISTMRPMVIAELFPGHGLEGISMEAEKIMRDIINEAADH